jgi:tetratricopeptide (TPR) repeat protein
MTTHAARTHPRRTPRPRKPAQGGLILAIVTCAGGPLLIPACSSGPRASDTDPAGQTVPAGQTFPAGQTDPIAALRERAARPSPTRRELEPPHPSLRSALGGEASDPRLTRPLDTLDPAEFLGDDPSDHAGAINAETPSREPDSPASPAQSVSPSVSEEDQLAALRLYAEARLVAADGEHNRAITLLDRAVSRDPTAPQIWRALGDARRAARFENSASEAYRRAAELGTDEPQALLLAGLGAVKRDEPRAAAAWLLRAVRAEPAHADPLIAYTAHAALGEALIELGYLSAGAEALAEGVQIPRAARVPTQIGREAADVQRRLGTLLVLQGDTLLRLERNDEAATAYEAARGLLGAEGVRDRLIYALRTSGNDAGAAVVLLDEIRETGRIAPDTARLLATLAESIKPRSLVADALESLDDRGSASRRADLVAVRAGTLPSREALELLTATLREDLTLSSPSARRLLLAGINAAAPESSTDAARTKAALRWILANIRQRPDLADNAAWALTSAPGLRRDLDAAITDESAPGAASGLLRAALAIRQDDRARILELLEHPPAAGESPDSLVTTTQLAAATGRWQSADRAVEALRTLDAPRALAAGLTATQRPAEALAIMRDLEPRSVDEFLERAALETALLDGIGDAERARHDLEAARDLDPLDDRIYAALLAYHAPDGPRPDDDAVTAVGRQLRMVRPESTLLRTMLSGELLRRGLTDDAAAIAVPLLRAAPTDTARQDAVLNLWRRRAAAQQAEQNELDLVRALITQHPNDPGLVRLLAGGLVLADEAENAEAAIVEFAAATGDRTLASLREQIVRDGLDDPERAEALALERLSPSPRSIDDSADLIALHAGAMARGDATPERVAAIRDAAESIPVDAVLTTAQRTAAGNGVARAAIVVDTARRNNTDIAAFEQPLLGLLGWSASRDLPLAPGIHGLRLDLLDQSGSNARTLLDAAEHAIAQQQPGSEIRRAFYRKAADQLVARDESAAAFGWLRERSIKPVDPDESLDTDAYQEWFRLVIVIGQDDPAGSVARAREMIDALGENTDSETSLIGAAWDIVRPEGPTWSTAGDLASPADVAGDLAYLFALYAPDAAPNATSPAATEAPQAETDNARTRFLRLALEYDPQHAWAANDLGYTMLEAGHDLAESERLIEIAYEGEPDQANIVDSLGWVRYHRGKVEDALDPETGELVEGAITLLERAVELSDEDDDGVVHDHLGDALYAAGRTEEAIAAWKQAARLANAALSRLRASGRANSVRSDELADLAVRAIMKPNALQLDQQPAVEPQRGVSPDAQNDPKNDPTTDSEDTQTGQ